MKTLEILFWVALGIVFYTYVGYGIFLYILVKIKELFKGRYDPDYSKDALPEVTLLIAAYNEEDVVEYKMKNCNEIDYPKDLFKIVWVTDGSTDRTNDLLKEYDNVTLLYEPARGGKTAAVNRAMRVITSPIIVLTDANTLLNKESILEIVARFIDPSVGCVAGEKRIAVAGSDVASASGEGFYWRYESILKDLDSRLYSAMGAAGELYAIRKELYEEMGKATLLDDFIQSMRIVINGYRIVYSPEAYAVESGSLDMGEEKKRKVRIAAGGLQSIYMLPELLNIFKRPLVSFQYISHRVLRWSLTPILLFLLLPLNIILAIGDQGLVYVLLLMAQLLFYFMSIAGAILASRRIKVKLLFIPYYFMFMNFNVLRGVVYLIKKSKGDGTWEKAKRA